MLNYKTKSYYCLKCGKNRSVESIYPRVSKTNNDKTVIWSKYVTCGSKKSKFSKKQEGSGILKKIPLLGNILF